MYQKLVIGEGDAPRLEQETIAKKKNVDANPDRMIICSDWPTTQRCGITYKKGDGKGCERVADRNARVDDETRRVKE